MVRGGEDYCVELLLGYEFVSGYRPRIPKNVLRVLAAWFYVSARASTWLLGTAHCVCSTDCGYTVAFVYTVRDGWFCVCIRLPLLFIYYMNIQYSKGSKTGLLSPIDNRSTQDVDRSYHTGNLQPLGL